MIKIKAIKMTESIHEIRELFSQAMEISKNKGERIYSTGGLWDEYITLKVMNDEQAWLPFFMISSDEACIEMTGKRLWNVYYHADGDTVEGLGIAPANSKSFNDDGIESYLKYKVADNDDLSKGWRGVLLQ
jgi:hypothetical protein